MPPLDECMICLMPARKFWTPDTPCKCAPVIHKKCWKEWTKIGTGLCIICRNELPIQIQENRQFGFCHFVYVINIILYVVFCFIVINTLGTKLILLRDEL